MTWCGFKPYNEFSGKPDLFGREVKFTNVNIIEALAASAALVMGEITEQTPLAVLTDLPNVEFQDHVPTPEELDGVMWPIEKDMYGKLLTSVKWLKGGGGK